MFESKTISAYLTSKEKYNVWFENGFAVLSDEKTIICTQNSPYLVLKENLNNGKSMVFQKVYYRIIRFVHVSETLNKVITGGDDKICRIHDLVSGVVIKSFQNFGIDDLNSCCSINNYVFILGHKSVVVVVDLHSNHSAKAFVPDDQFILDYTITLMTLPVDNNQMLGFISGIRSPCTIVFRLQDYDSLFQQIENDNVKFEIVDSIWKYLK